MLITETWIKWEIMRVFYLKNKQWPSTDSQQATRMDGGSLLDWTMLHPVSEEANIHLAWLFSNSYAPDGGPNNLPNRMPNGYVLSHVEFWARFQIDKTVKLRQTLW